MLSFLMLLLIRSISSQQQSAVDSSCSEHTIPFSFQNDKNGNPTLLCTSPVCFGEKRFYEMKRDDMIPVTESETKSLFGLDSYIHKAQCYKFYQNVSCTGEVQWTVGLLLEDNGSSVKAKWKCCNYEGLRHARALKTVVVKVGESYTGGEVYQNSRRVAFDLIKEVQLSFDNQHRPQYELKIMRLACIPKPIDTKNKLISDENSELNGSAMDISSEYDAEEYVFTNQHHTKYSKPRRRSTVMEDENFDDLFSPRHRMAHRRVFSLRRRPFYRPIIDDYDYYDYDPVIVKRPSSHRRIITDGLWPTNLGIIGRNRPVLAAAPVSSTLYEISSPNMVEGDYSQFIESDGQATPTSVSAEVYSQLSATVGALTNDYNDVNNQPAQIEEHFVLTIERISPSSGQFLQTYSGLQYPPSGVQYLHSGVPYSPQRPAIPSEPKSITIAQRTVPAYSGGNVPVRNDTLSLEVLCKCLQYYNGYFETLQCFSSDATVQTPNRIKRIDELQVGDQVLSIDESLISYSPVVMFLHRSENESAVFNKIILENDEIIKLTDYHLLYVTDCAVGEKLRLIFAKDVRLGHCLHVAVKQSNNLVPVQVSAIQRVIGKGFYAPLTANGDIIVNSILSSCHSNIAMQTLQQSMFNLLRKLRSLMLADHTTNGLLPGIRFLIHISNFFLPESIVW
uniref:Hint domain-containing protein n=1 Tax=Setaria digitata TaxID=48799 RepID=A0A915PKE2_9BILA